MQSSVGVVIPAYRPDVGRLEAYVAALHERLSPERIRIELDAPEPGMLDALSDLPAEINASMDRRGKGAAITAGFEALDTDVLAFADADGSTPVESLDDVVSALDRGSADLAVGSRRHPEARILSHQTYARRRLGDVFAWLARRLLDVRLYDFQCGAKAITREAWRAVRSHLYEPEFAWDIELIAMVGALEYDIVEVPVSWEDQPGSTVSPLGTTIELAVALVTSRHRAKLLREDPLHEVIASRRSHPTPLVERGVAEGPDE